MLQSVFRPAGRLRSIGLASCAAAALLAFGARAADTPATEAKPALLPIKNFLARSALSSAELSPSGRYLAVVRADGRGEAVYVYDFETRKSQAVLSIAQLAAEKGHGQIDWVRWKGDDRLLASVRIREDKRVGDKPDARVYDVAESKALFALDRDGGRRVTLMQDAIGLRIYGRRRHGEVLDTLRKDPSHVLMVAPRDDRLDVVRIDVGTGAQETVERGAQGVFDYDTDRDGQVVVRYRRAGVSGRGWLVVEGRAAGEAEWTKVVEVHSSDVREFSDFEILEAADKPGQLYVAVRPRSAEDGDTTAVRVYDVKTKTLGDKIWSDPRYDVTGLVRNAATGEIMAGCYWADVRVCDFKDPALAATFKGLSKFFDGERSLEVVSSSADGDKWLLDVSGPDERGSYYLYDGKTKKVDLIGDRYPWLPMSLLGTMRRFDYHARDGQALSGYVSEPPGAGKGPLPLVVMPHGGPEVRDHFEFDTWAQFLATRGYVVFQPNFRGSDGFGRRFAEAGYGQWGGVMQDDVTDGVRALIASGRVDPARVCIVGASYGGFAALFGAMQNPDLYRCSVSIAGDADLVESMAWERSEYGGDSPTYRYWLKSMGDPSKDRERMIAKSPARHAEAFAGPVLLIHGAWDGTVSVEQSRLMKKALERAGKKVRYVELPHAGHGGWSDKDHTTILTELETFLADNLGGARTSAPAEAASGSQ